MPKLDSDITQVFPTLSYRTATDPRVVLYFSAGARKMRRRERYRKAFDYSDIKRCFDYLSSWGADYENSIDLILVG